MTGNQDSASSTFNTPTPAALAGSIKTAGRLCRHAAKAGGATRAAGLITAFLFLGHSTGQIAESNE
jgi:hypothetical protein